MPTTVTHTFVSAIADGADATLVRPVNWNATHTIDGLGFNSYHFGHLDLVGTERLILTSTQELVLSGFTRLDSIIVGVPKSFSSPSFTVLDDYLYDQLFRVTLRGNNRATLQGTADLYITDDAGARSRLVLSGRG